MAIANNSDRGLKDESDIAGFFKLYNKNLVANDFEKIDRTKIILFAEKFGKKELIEKYLIELDSHEKEQHHL